MGGVSPIGSVDVYDDDVYGYDGDDDAYDAVGASGRHAVALDDAALMSGPRRVNSCNRRRAE